MFEAKMGAHIPAHAGSVIQATPDAQRHVFPAILVRLALELLIELVGTRKHLQGGFTGVDFLLRIIERRIPECHDRVADVFVDGSVALNDSVSYWRQKTVHQARQTFWSL